MALNLIPPRVAFVDASGCLTPEAFRYFNALFIRVGKENGLGSDDLAALSQLSDRGADVAALRAEIDALRAEIASNRDAHAAAAEAKSYTQQVEVSYALGGYQVNWSSPGAIGYYTPNTGSFSVLDVAAGDAANPPFYMNKDKTTGWFSNATGYWGFSVGGIQTVTLDASGMSVSRQFRSTVATGAPPFQIFSTTKVPNLYVDRAALADAATVLASPSSYPADATDLPTCIALANALKTAALAKGL